MHRPLRLLALVASSVLGAALACTVEPDPPEDTEAALCEALETNATSTGTFDIEITNLRAEPVFIGPLGCGVQIYNLSDANGDPVAPVRSFCECTCAEMFADTETYNDCISCSNDCGPDLPLLRLEPGASYAASWSGLYYQREEAPISCFVDAPFPTACTTAYQPEPADWTLSIQTHTIATECWQGEADCSCSEGETSCEIYPDSAEADQLLTSTFDPSQPTTLELSID